MQFLQFLINSYKIWREDSSKNLICLKSSLELPKMQKSFRTLSPYYTLDLVSELQKRQKFHLQIALAPSWFPARFNPLISPSVIKKADTLCSETKKPSNIRKFLEVAIDVAYSKTYNMCMMQRSAAQSSYKIRSISGAP